MIRDIDSLKRKRFDLVIVGGGIYGSFIAWDSTLRGLSVALIEKNDFCSGTSYNSQKIVHGGIRYLQHMDLKRVLESIRERSILRSIAPHLVHPLSSIVPVYGHGFSGREGFYLASKFYNLLSIRSGFPKSRFLSKEEFLRIVPGLDDNRLNGGLEWTDAQIYNTERFVISLLRGASELGASIANYVSAQRLLVNGDQVEGIEVVDSLTGSKFEIKSRVVINASGPWSKENFKQINMLNTFAKALILVTPKEINKSHAIGIPSHIQYSGTDEIIKKGYRFLFITPWRDKSLIGITHAPYQGDPSEFKITEKDIQVLLKEFNNAYPFQALDRSEISYLYAGLIPSTGKSSFGQAELLKEYQIIDHEKINNLDGLISVVGVKYTSARFVAEKVVNLASKKLNLKRGKSESSSKPIWGGDITNIEDYLAMSLKGEERLPNEILTHLIYNYGSKYKNILYSFDNYENSGEVISESSTNIVAEVINGIRDEMAQSLLDILLRRTDMGNGGYPGSDALKKVAFIAASEIGWSSEKTIEEVEKAKRHYSLVSNEQYSSS